MSLLELLFALLLVCLMAGTAVVGALVWTLVRRLDGQAGSQADRQAELLGDVAELKARIQSGDQSQESQAIELRERLSQTQSALEGLRSAVSARQPIEEEARASLRRMESVIAGSSSRGAAGERILEEALRHLPPEMLQRNVWVGGRVVELALRLPGGKLLPMDSKWVSSPALEQLAEPGLDASRRANLIGQVEREVERRVREVGQYIDPATTTPFALAVIPDAAYDVCRGAIVNAHHRHVMVVGYAMALPYLLTLYQLHLQFARTVDMEKLQSALIDMERQVDVLEGILENKIQRSLTVLQNAYTEGRQATAKIRASAQGAQVPSPARGAETNGQDGPGENLSTGSGDLPPEISPPPAQAPAEFSPPPAQAPAEFSTETLRLALIDSVQ